MKACRALSKLMNLDAQLVIEVYFETRQQRAVERSERLAAVGELAASIAHEVRNPLAGMKGALEVLRKGMAADTTKREIMDELVAQIVRLETLVRDLLTFAQPRPLNRHAVDLHEILERVLRFVQEGIDASGITVEKRYQDPIDPISADPQQLEQVFLNLIDNAVQAMEGGGTLTLDTRQTDGSVTIAFQDTGKGIPAADLHRIFHPFFTTKHRGSGLGLSIVQKIVEAHDGTLRVESEPGQGTRILVLLPRREPSHAA
jgi:two-component system sensor histidine kinase HydH